jgi:ATP-dependent DNA helicase RecQ
MHAPLDTLRETFGFDAFLPGQAEVIEHLMAGCSAAAVFPTGGGKSLCYQLPALCFDGLTLVISPLIALMKDQIDRLQRLGVAAARLDSSLTAEQYGEIMGAVRAGSLRLLYVAPERFNNERFRESVRRVRVSLFAVDEAHCISEWGHNFRPEYLKLAGFARLCGAERTLGLTATATPKVLDDICDGLGIARECAVRTGFYRPNLSLHFTPLAVTEHDAALLRQVANRSPGPTIVYVTLQRTAERVAALLAREGLAARAYHAGLEDEARAGVQEWFLASDGAIVVATIAFGMGIDKPDIRYVYHYNMPKSLENYAQEIGRSGRDGLPATCETFVCPEDLTVLQNFAYGNTPALDAVRGLADQLFANDPDQSELELNIYELSRRHDIRLLVVRTLLTYLEIDRYLRAGTPVFSGYRFRPLLSSEEVLAGFDDRRRQFLRDLFRQARKARTWFDVDLAQAAVALDAPRDRLVRALDYLAERQLLEVRASGVRHTYRRVRQPEDLGALAGRLHQRTVDHERRELRRLEAVLELVACDCCQTSFLGAHFAEPLAQRCGHCSWCANGQKRAVLLPPPSAAFDEDLWQRATEVRRQHPDSLADPRTAARFLAGLSSPSLSRKRLAGHPLFGSLAHVPFAVLFDRLDDAAEIG